MKQCLLANHHHLYVCNEGFSLLYLSLKDIKLFSHSQEKHFAEIRFLATSQISLVTSCGRPDPMLGTAVLLLYLFKKISSAWKIFYASHFCIPRYTVTVLLCAYKINHYNVNIWKHSSCGHTYSSCTNTLTRDLFTLFSVWLLTWSGFSTQHSYPICMFLLFTLTKST